MELSVQLIGTSHVEAIRRASRLTGLEIINIDQESGIKKNDVLSFSGPLSKKPDLVFLAIGGVFPSIVGLIEHELPFAVGDHDTGQVPEGDRFFIPEQLMRDFFSQKQTVRYNLKRQCIDHYKSTSIVICLAPPPPRGKLDHLENPGRFANLLKQGFAPAHLRKKLYDLDMEIFRDFCLEAGVTYIPAPPDALDELGLLHDDYSLKDPVHGNDRYGALVADQMQQFISRMVVRPADGTHT